MLGPGFIALFPGGVIVDLVHLLGQIDLAGQHDVGITMPGRPLHGLPAGSTGHPNRRIGLLQRDGPGVHVPVVEVLALPAERAGGRPCLDEEVVGLFEALPVEVRGHVVRQALTAAAADHAGDEAAPRNHIDHCDLLGQPEGIVVDGQDVAEDHDLGLGGDASENGGRHVGHAVHAERGAVVLVDHDPVEAHLLGVDLLVQVAVVEAGSTKGVVLAVAHLHDAGPPGHGPVFFLPGLLGKVAYKHGADLPLPLSLSGRGIDTLVAVYIPPASCPVAVNLPDTQ